MYLRFNFQQNSDPKYSSNVVLEENQCYEVACTKFRFGIYKKRLGLIEKPINCGKSPA